MTDLLRLQMIEQLFPARDPLDVDVVVLRELKAHVIAERIDPGQRIAITAGSRGIRDQIPVLRTLVAALREAGAAPFVVPCMGSHGGATTEGQRRVLADLGVTERAVGAPGVATMDVVALDGVEPFGEPVVVSRDIAQADGIVVVNRVKPHTDFHGEVESGLVKMLVIGAGKHAGAPWPLTA